MPISKILVCYYQGENRMAKWKDGESGNPKGRPKGKISQSTKVRNLLESRSEELVETVIRLALEGDLIALKMWIDRVCPPLKPKDEFPGFDSFKNSLDAANKCMALMAEGILPPSDVKAIMETVVQNMEVEEMVEKKNEFLEWGFGTLHRG